MAGRIPKSFIEDLLSRTDIVALIDARVPLKKAGVNFKANCPFHNEKTPSFSVSPKKQIYHCFGCGANGNAIGFLMDYEHKDFVEAVEALATELGLTVPRENNLPLEQKPKSEIDLYAVMERAAKFYFQQLKNNQPAINYLKQRGLSGEICKRFQIGYAPQSWDQLIRFFSDLPNKLKHLSELGLVVMKDNGQGYDRFRNRIMFPIRNRLGKVIGFGGRVIDPNDQPKYLNSPETILFHKGEELYGLYEVLSSKRRIEKLMIVEGYMDVVALAQFGIDYAVATLGTATTKTHITKLMRYSKELIFCFDGDNAGKKAAWRALETILPIINDEMQIKFLFLPEEDDPDSLIRRIGKDKFEALYTKVSSVVDWFFQQLASNVDLTTMEGRARLIKTASHYFNEMSETTLKQLMLERLASLTRMSVSQLDTMMGKQETTKLMISGSEQKFPSVLRLALALVLQHPEQFQSIVIPEWLQNIETSGLQVLKKVLIAIQNQKQISTAIILEQFREQEALFSKLAAVAGLELHVPENGVMTEFLGALKQLQKQYEEQLVEQLLRKAELKELTVDEKKQLQILILRQKESI